MTELIFSGIAPKPMGDKWMILTFYVHIKFEKWPKICSADKATFGIL